MEKLVEITNNEKEKLNNLLQMYLHDISLYFFIDFDSEKGKYLYDSIDKYFESEDNYAYFLVNDNDIVGFSLVDKLEDTFCIQEFFIMNNYKRNGFGKTFTKLIFDKHPTNWIVKTLPKSPVAESFWDKIIRDYTNNNYNKSYIGKYNRAVFEFNNK